jgi:uncharacterized protein YjbJ (UPF0337 family)
MNRNRVEGQWKRLKGKAPARWGRLVHDERVRLRGMRDQAEGAVQRAHGRCIDALDRERDIWSNSLDDVAI